MDFDFQWRFQACVLCLKATPQLQSSSRVPAESALACISPGQADMLVLRSGSCQGLMTQTFTEILEQLMVGDSLYHISGTHCIMQGAWQRWQTACRLGMSADTPLHLQCAPTPQQHESSHMLLSEVLVIMPFNQRKYSIIHQVWSL